jgi:hypothetical protein
MRIEARIFRDSSTGISQVVMAAAVIRYSLAPVFSTRAPSRFKSWAMTRVSSISGMFFKVTGSSVRRAAARQGRAAFLLPLALTLPLRGHLPSISYLCMCSPFGAIFPTEGSAGRARIWVASSSAGKSAFAKRANSIGNSRFLSMTGAAGIVVFVMVLSKPWYRVKKMAHS